MGTFYLTRSDTITIWTTKAKSEEEAIAAFAHCFGGDWQSVGRDGFGGDWQSVGCPWTEYART